MAGVLPPWEQALPLLAAVKNHGDLAVKLSSLKQVKDILLNLEPSLAAELLPYLVELQSSPETLVRKYLIEVIDEIGTNRMEHLSILFPALLLLLKDRNPAVAKQSIVSGTRFFNRVLEELSFQFQRCGMVERWLEDLWMWMIKFRDTVLGIIHEVGVVGPKLLAMKFLETCILQFSLDLSESERSIPEDTPRNENTFNISRIIDGHLLLDPRILASDANRYVGLLLEMLRPSTRFPGSLTISAVNSLAAISRKRPIYYKSVLTALLEFDQAIETAKGRHTASIRYSLRTAFLGFLRCTHSVIAESRERLLTVLRASNAGDAADQVIRQTDKIMRNIERERAARDLRLSKDAQVPNQLPISRDTTRKRLAPLEKEDQNHSFDVTAKKSRHGTDDKATASADISGVGQDRMNGVLTPVEQMIAMIGALLAEGERGLDSLELLVSNIHPDLLADIVITNMKHLPKNILLLGGHSNLSSDRSCDDSRGPAQAVMSNGFTTSTQTSSFASQVPISTSNTVTSPVSDISVSSNLTTDSKRDPRRDPRRLDPRRAVVPVDVPPSFVEENFKTVPNYATQSDLDAYSSCHPVSPLLVPSSSGSFSVPVSPKIGTDLSLSELLVAPYTDEPIPKNEIQDTEAEEFASERESNDASRFSPSPDVKIHDIVSCEPMDVAMLDEAYSPSSQETDQNSLNISNVDASEIMSSELPIAPLYIELDEVHQRNVRKQALERVVILYQDLPQTTFKEIPMALVARLFGQTNVDDVVGMVRRHVVSDYEQQKGHEFVMQILYHLQSLIISDSVPSAAAVYDKFLLGVAKSLLDDLPASDKSFSRLLSDIPMIPDSMLRLLEDICTESNSGGDGHDGDRVTQGLGAVWSLILGRPHNRRTCLDIALKCAVHLKDDVRVKSIRLVANKLYAVSYISKNIEQFATDMYLSSIHQRSDTSLSQSLESENRMGGQVELQETSISGSQISETGSSVTDSSVTYSQAQSLTSLYFALCTKKPSLLQLVFDNFAHAPKTVKQAVHRHIPNLVRALGSSCRELLDIISNPPQGSEPLLTQVLHELSEGTPPSPDFIATVKTLYATRLKDATILIPIISAFSREEVLPIFPQLVRLPLDKFQTALAHILQGSALSGPALSPVEVLVAIHDVSPERDGVPLKKITDACSACFEQRTVFTESVLSKALNQMVDRTPLPLLFMRTVIQAIDAFPTLVDFVMEVLSKLVQRQIWRMPKLWVGFLKCISQTQPHSFRVLLQLPTPQLESALTKYANLRAPLTAFANQPSVKTSIPRSTLVLLGIAYGEHNNYNNQPHPMASFNASDAVSSSVRGATFT